MKKTKRSAKKTGAAAKVAHPFELVSSVEAQISDGGGCTTWQGYRTRTSRKKPAHWPDFYVATLMRNSSGKKGTSYDLVAIGGQSPWHAIKYTVLSHGAEVAFSIKGVATVVAPGASIEVPAYEKGDEKCPPTIRFEGDVLFLRAEPVVKLAKNDGKGWPTNPPKIPPPPYPGGGNSGAD